MLLNEDTAIITSMNLYEASEKNRELGVLIEKNCDRVLYDTTRDEVESIKNNSERKRFKNADVSPGYCIRCGAKIPFDPERPYCRSCFGVWAQWRRNISGTFLPLLWRKGRHHNAEAA